MNVRLSMIKTACYFLVNHWKWKKSEGYVSSDIIISEEMDTIIQGHRLLIKRAHLLQVLCKEWKFVNLYYRRDFLGVSSGLMNDTLFTTLVKSTESKMTPTFATWVHVMDA